MTSRVLLPIGAVLLGLSLSACEPADVSFASDVQPILAKNCVGCHDSTGEGVAASGFSVASYEGVMRGTKFGAVVVPGSSISSTLYRVVAQKTAPEIQMPPHHAEALAKGRGAPLTVKQVDIIAAWIDQGAKNN